MLCLSQTRTWIFKVLCRHLFFCEWFSSFCWKSTLENTEGQSRETGNTCHTRRRKTNQKHNTICAWHHYAQANTNNVNKTWAFIQTTGSKDEPNIVFIRKSLRTSQHGTQNIKTHNRTTQKTKKTEQHVPYQRIADFRSLIFFSSLLSKFLLSSHSFL